MATPEQFYHGPAYRWIDNIHYETWETLPLCTVTVSCFIGADAGWKFTNGSFNFFCGPGVGSAVTEATGLVIIALPNGRLFKADLKAETAEFMDYSDDAAMVAPEFR